MRLRLLVPPVLVLACAVGTYAAFAQAEPARDLTLAEPAAPVLVVACTAGATGVSGDVAVAARDGVHVRFVNRTDVEQWIGTAFTGDLLAPGASKEVVSQVPPGDQEQLACSPESLEPTTPRTAVEVTDPGGVFVEVPDCDGTSTIRDFVTGSERRGDPVELTLEDSPDARGVGYPEGVPRQVFTGTELLGWEGSDRTGWVPTHLTTC